MKFPSGVGHGVSGAGIRRFWGVGIDFLCSVNVLFLFLWIFIFMDYGIIFGGLTAREIPSGNFGIGISLRFFGIGNSRGFLGGLGLRILRFLGIFGIGNPEIYLGLGFLRFLGIFRAENSKIFSGEIWDSESSDSSGNFGIGNKIPREFRDC